MATVVTLNPAQTPAPASVYGYIMLGDSRLHKFSPDTVIKEAMRTLKDQGILTITKVAVSISKNVNNGSTWVDSNEDVDVSKSFRQLNIVYAEGRVEKAVSVSQVAKGA
jgi:hypothetical protein